MEEVLSNDYFHIIIRLILAGIMGGLIGLEREMNNHPAGFRTHILVALGSALIMLTSLYGFSDYIGSHENIRFDPSRIPSNIVTGIGFLGAGTILRHGFTVTGLTTAASLWVVAAIGMAIGSGFYLGGMITALFVLVSLAILARIDPYITRTRQLIPIRVNVVDKPGKLGEISSVLGVNKINVKNVSIHEEERDEHKDNCVSVMFLVRLPKSIDVLHITDQIKQVNGVKEVNFGENTE